MRSGWQRDFRDTAEYREAYSLYKSVRQPGTGQISDAAEIDASPDRRFAVFSATIVEKLEGSPPTRISEVELATGGVRVLTFGPGSDRAARYSPNGRQIAFLSDRHKAGDYQLYVLSRDSGGAQATPRVDGWVEYLHWSPDGRRILLGVAGHGADTAGVQGAIAGDKPTEAVPSWMPEVEAGDHDHGWRQAWIYDIATGESSRVSPPKTNVWEAAWCGNERLVMLTSPGPDEGLWYSAQIELLELRSARSRVIHEPRDQVGWLAASPRGSSIAWIEAICSDRCAVAGDLTLLDVESNASRLTQVNGMDVTHAQWCSEISLFVAGHRGFDTVIGLYDLPSKTFVESWQGRDVTGSGRYITASPLNSNGDCVFVAEGFAQAPEIAVIHGGSYQTVKSFALGSEHGLHGASVETVTWQAPDGLEIQGWLLRPKEQGPHPLILCIHGGPIAHWRPLWLGRRHVHLRMLLQRGYAILFPNPRGSSARGQDFARRIIGEMGGADTQDYLSGIDHLVARGIADRARLGVTGISYGGFMTCWLLTQDTRFSAGVAVSPVTNWLTEHLISNLSQWVRAFIADRYTNSGGNYFRRSPVMHADRVVAPTLVICGALDRCTPPEEAVQFHRALKENGVDTVLLTYPREGHGVRQFPAIIDYAARLTAWFEEHIPSVRAC